VVMTNVEIAGKIVHAFDTLRDLIGASFLIITVN